MAEEALIIFKVLTIQVASTEYIELLPTIVEFLYKYIN